MTVAKPRPYVARTFDLHGLEGISDRTLELHFKLYQGYVQETNRLDEQIARFVEDARIDPDEVPAYSELTRRLGFEYNGMVLHERYFENLTAQGRGDPPSRSRFRKALASGFGRYDVWKADFTGVGRMRGVGWAICNLNPANGRLSNHWVSGHDVGNVAGFMPLLVMDVWEHAYLLDYEPSRRGEYIEAFFANVAWDTVEQRLEGGLVTLIELLVLLLIAGVVGAIAQSLAGFSRGGCLTSIAVGFVGALLGTWLARSLGLPELFVISVGGTGFPIVWSIIGAALFVALIALISRGRAAD